VELITDPELSFTRLDLYYKRPPQAPGGDLASYRQNLINELVDRMLSLRFEEAVSKPETPYVYAGAGNIRFGASSRYYIMAAQAKTGNAEAALREMLREKESISRYGFTSVELERAKGSLLSDLTQAVSEKDRQYSNSYVGQFTDHFLEEQMVPGVEWELDAAGKLLPAIGVQDISRTIRDYFAADDLSVFIMAPEAERAGLPQEDQVRRLVTEARWAQMTPPSAEALSGELIHEEPQAGLILEESEDPETGALIWELGNGARVILKETRNRNNELTLYALAKGGTTSAGEDADVSAELAAEMMEASGLGPYSRPELIKTLADKQVSISFWTSNYLRGFQGSAASGDVKTLFEMLYLSFTQPRLDPEAVEALLDQYRTNLALQDEDPETVFSNGITKTIYGNHPRFKPLETADLSRVSPEDAAAFLKTALNPGDYTFVFSGNLDPPLIRKYTETYLASIPPGQPWNNWTDPGITRPGKVEEIIYKGKEEKSLVFLGWYTPEAYSEPAAVTAAALSEYLDIVLTEEIREALGGVYSISVNASLSPIPSGELAMAVYFACDPRRTRELIAAVEARISRTAAELPDAGIFAEAIEALKKDFESSMQKNTYIARNYANFTLITGLPLSGLEKRPELYDNVSTTGMQNLTRRLLRNGPARVILYPEGWKE
jgi:zinc protease